jgi:hypothetical protein
MSDNLYPRSGRYLLAEPAEQAQERQKEAAQVSNSLPILQEIVTNLGERIAFYNSVDSVPQGVLTDPEKFMHIVAANRLTRDNLEAEKSRIEELIKAHSK